MPPRSPRTRALVVAATLGTVLSLAAAPTVAALGAVSETRTVSWPSSVTVNAPCGDDRHVTFGGFKTNTDLTVNHAWSFPNAMAPTGKQVATWSVKAAAEFVGKDSKITSIAYCTAGAKPLVVRATVTGVVTDADPAIATASCPEGRTLIGGGYSATGRVIPIGLERVGSNAWQVSLINRESAEIKVTAIAICGKGSKPAAVEQRVLVKEGAATGGTTTAECKSGKKVVFAGLRAEWNTISGLNAMPTAWWRPTATTVRATAIHDIIGPSINQSSELVAIAYCR